MRPRFTFIVCVFLCVLCVCVCCVFDCIRNTAMLREALVHVVCCQPKADGGKIFSNRLNLKPDQLVVFPCGGLVGEGKAAHASDEDIHQDKYVILHMCCLVLVHCSLTVLYRLRVAMHMYVLWQQSALRLRNTADAAHFAVFGLRQVDADDFGRRLGAKTCSCIKDPRSFSRQGQRYSTFARLRWVFTCERSAFLRAKGHISAGKSRVWLTCSSSAVLSCGIVVPATLYVIQQRVQWSYDLCLSVTVWRRGCQPGE